MNEVQKSLRFVHGWFLTIDHMLSVLWDPYEWILEYFEICIIDDPWLYAIY